MVGYHGGATAVAATLTPFSRAAGGSGGFGSANVGLRVRGIGDVSVVGDEPAAAGASPGGCAGLVARVCSRRLRRLPISSHYVGGPDRGDPGQHVDGPVDAAGAGRRCGYGRAGQCARRRGLADMPKFVGDVTPMKGLGGGGGGMGAGMAGEFGKARLVGAMSVPPTWQGSMPKGMASSAMAGWVVCKRRGDGGGGRGRRCRLVVACR